MTAGVCGGANFTTARARSRTFLQLAYLSLSSPFRLGTMDEGRALNIQALLQSPTLGGCFPQGLHCLLFSLCCDKIPKRSNLREDGFIASPHLRRNTVHEGTGGLLGSDVTSVVRREGDMNAAALLIIFCSLFYSVWDPSSWGDTTHIHHGSSLPYDIWPRAVSPKRLQM